MSIELIIPENPEPIITGLGYAFGIEDANGEVIVATSVVMKQTKGAGLKVAGLDHSAAARSCSASIVKFAEAMDGQASRVRYMTPAEYAAWCEENDDDIDIEERDADLIDDGIDDDADADESDA